MARDLYETTVALPDVTGTLKVLSGVKVSVIPRGAQDVPNSLVDIFASDTGATRGADPKSGATGINPLVTVESGSIRFWAEGPYEYDLVFEDTEAPARIADRIGWNAVPAKLGSIPTSYLAEDAGISQKMLSAKVVEQQIPIGGVIEWWRPPASGGGAPVSPPSGFEIADGRVINQHDFPGVSGSITVPNLQNVYILGATVAKADGAGADVADGTINTPGGGPGIRGTTGANNHLLVAAQVPIIQPVLHDPGHGHAYHDPGHYHTPPGGGYFATYQGGSGVVYQNGTGEARPGADGTSITPTNISIDSAMSNITIDSIGGGSTHNNRPMSYGLLRLVKVRRS